MKAMTRQELADCAGVTTKTLNNYIKRHWDVLWTMGLRPNQILPPNVVAWLVDKYGIDIKD